MQKLSLSKQTFEKLRTENCIYVDKTAQLYNLLQGSGVYFMARPRRFGKSLLIDTLDCIFQGRKEFFVDLAISKTNYQWPVHPVVRIDFSNINRRTPELFAEDFRKILYQYAQKYGIDLGGDQELGSIGRTLFEQLHAKTGARVVLLIDEYDKPILDHIDKPEIAEEIRAVMRSFYEVHKPSEQHLQFTFITGVGRFARASIFSGMNHLTDLSEDYRAATLVGYTQTELEQYFADYLNDLAPEFGGIKNLLATIKNWYNGFRFSDKDTRVYNPFSVMTFFDKKILRNYWFSTGTPHFLLKLMSNYEPWHWNHDQQRILGAEELMIHDVAHLTADVLMYQTGYLSINNLVPSPEGDFAFELDFPNLEVRKSLQPYLLAAITKTSYDQAAQLRRDLNDSLREGDTESFMQLMKAQFARFPYQLQPRRRPERIYHLLFGAICFTLECQTQLEVSVSNGSIDAVLTNQDYIYVIEFKVDDSASIALEQIKSKGYADSYLNQGKKVVLIGVSFKSTDRSLGAWISAQL